ncbi:MAG: rhodanese-like domain-containing protein [Kiloniellales bacterium]|nr:rhodanese-like domain-containing protein [Kiloniellales bacterium]
MSDGTYAGEVTSAEAFEILQSDDQAVLVDVRTLPEWQFVGVPDLRGIGKEPVFLSWQVYPQMALHPEFEQRLRDQGVGPENKVLLLCRSGQRSRSAAMALTAAGFGAAYNVSDGFEGRPDGGGQRGKIEGWKAAGLPWVQQ